jgi:hypothetical protein
VNPNGFGPVNVRKAGDYSLASGFCLTFAWWRASGGFGDLTEALYGDDQRLAKRCQVSTTVSGFSEIDTMPSADSHSAKSGWSLGP